MIAYICLGYARRIAYIGAYMGVEHPLFACSSPSKADLRPLEGVWRDGFVSVGDKRERSAKRAI